MTVHKCPTLDLHKYFARPPEKRQENGRRQWVENRRSCHAACVCGSEHLKKFPKMRKVKQTSALFAVLPSVFSFALSVFPSPSRIAEHFPPFHGCHFVSRAVKSFPRFFPHCFSFIFQLTFIYFVCFSICFLWVCVGAL